jgi:hypothetical protein
MTTDKSGALHLPKKWLHDGGTTEISRGEQSVEQVAAYEQASGAEPASRTKAAHASRKKTNFAAIDQPPANAQAYAASADGQDLRLTRADSQAAIQQVTSGAPAPSGQPGDPQAVAAADQAAAPEAPADAKPAKKSRAAHKNHAKKTIDKPAGETKLAASDATTDDGVVAGKHHKKHNTPKKSAEAEEAAASAPPQPTAAQ